jgi:type I restriction enzyme R subunit
MTKIGNRNVDTSFEIYLATYKVIRIDLDKELTGWRPEKGKQDKYGQDIEDRIYNQKDFDKMLVIDQRTQLVAWKVTELLKLRVQRPFAVKLCIDYLYAKLKIGQSDVFSY